MSKFKNFVNNVNNKIQSFDAPDLRALWKALKSSGAAVRAEYDTQKKVHEKAREEAKKQKVYEVSLRDIKDMLGDDVNNLPKNVRDLFQDLLQDSEEDKQ